jgi:DNA polymerase-3 subunit gamma/tau
MAHAVDLPPPDELARIAKSGSAPATNVKPLPLRSESVSSPGPSGGAGLQVAVAAATAMEVPSSHSAREPVAFSDFASLVKFVGEKRDIKLKGELERYVRPIAVSESRIEFALEKDAPQGLANELMRKLEAWTGRRILVTVAREGGAEPLLRQRRSAEAVAMQEARSNPAVQAILKTFPGAEIISVREPQLPTFTSPEEPDEESH